MSQVLISIITPIYNTAPYLPTCIDSILAQSYSHWELLLVDDGSSDASVQIAEEYLQRDSRIRLLKLPKNQGQAVARNLALRESKGELLGFVDSDDYIEHTMYAEMLELLEKHEADICICDSVKEAEIGVDGNKNYEISVERGIRQDANKTLKENIFMADSPFMLPNKLLRRKLFTDHNISFPEGLIWEDTSVCALLLGHARKIAYLERPLYHIRARAGSTTRQAHKTQAQLRRYVQDYLANLRIIHAHQRLYSFQEWQAMTYRFLIHLNTLEHELRFQARGLNRYQLYLQIFAELRRLFTYTPKVILRVLYNMSITLLFPNSSKVKD